MAKEKQNIDAKENLKKLKNKGMGFFGEFKTFISRGNVMDLAIGVIIGNAFSKIVTSLTNNILMPLVGVLIGGFDFNGLTAQISVWGREVTLRYGEFIQNTVDFLLTAFCIFIVIKIMNTMFAKKQEKKEETKPAKSDEVVLLEEIRDLLKKQK